MTERQIRTDALLSGQLQEEERSHAIKCNYQIEHNGPFPYHVDRCQVKLEDNHEHRQKMNLLLYSIPINYQTIMMSRLPTWFK